MAVTLEELMTVFDSDTKGFERGKERVKQGLKEVGETAEHTAEKLQKVNADDAILKSQRAILKMQSTLIKADADLNKYNATTQSASSGSASFGDQIKSIGSNLANIKAGIDIVKDIGGFFFDMAKGAADAGSKFHDLNLQTGVSVETFSGLQLQLKQSGTDMDALARGAVFLQKNLGEAASGNKELQRAFAALGVKDVRAALADTDGTLRTVIKSLGQMESAGERNAAGSKVLGKGFKELSVFVADTKGNIDEVVEASRSAGRVMTDEAAAAADEFGDQLDALSGAATIAARNFGMELVPEITRGMTDMTGALEKNASLWREWGQGVADAIRGARETWDSWGGRAAQAAGSYFWNTSPVGWAVNNARFHGAQSREAERQRLVNDPGTAVQAMVGSQTAFLSGLAKYWMAPKGGDSGFFSPGAKGAKARKDELDKLKAFAKEWEFTVTALTGGKHNTGSAHYQGRAMDVSVRGKSDQEIRAFMEAAKTAGYGVRDERTRPEGQKVWSGPHLHLELLGKAAQAVNKDFEAQEQILTNLTRALADGDLELQSFTRSTAEQQIATEYLRLGIGQLTGNAQELGETLFAQRAEQIKSIEATKEQANALMKLVELNKEAGKGFNSEDLLKPGKAVGTADEGVHKALDLSNVKEDYWKTLRESWRDNLQYMREDGQQILGNFFVDLQHGFKDATLGMLQSFMSMLSQMAAQSAASAVWSALLNIAGSALSGSLGGLFGGSSLPGANVGGGAWSGLKFGGFATGGSFLVGGGGGTDKTPVSFMATRGERVTVETPEQQKRGGGAPIINFHITAPAGNVPRETQNQISRRMVRALEAAKRADY